MVRWPRREARLVRRLRGRRIGSRAQISRAYEGAYFGDGRDPLDRMGLSGYERYDRDSSNASVSASDLRE